MPRIKAKLSDIQIKNLKPKAKAYKQADEGGLNILVRPTGTKVWQIPYQLAGKYNVYTIGQYPDISAAEARKRRDEIKDLIRQGIDPNLDKKAQRLTNQGQSDRTFEAIANEWFDQQVWVTKHKKNIQKKFAEDVFTKVGAYQIDKIKPADVIVVLKAIEARGSTDVAKRTCQHMSAIFEYAIVKGVCEYNPAMGRSKVIKSVPVKHRPHLREEQLPKFLNDLENYRGGRLVQLAMKLLMLTMLRPGELRNGRWDEIDFKKKLWRTHVDYDKSLGQLYEEHKNAEKKLPEIKQSQLDSVVEKCESAIRDMHRPIVYSKTADEAQISCSINGKSRPIGGRLNSDSFDYINYTKHGTELEKIEGFVSSYNSNTYKGRIFIPEVHRPIPFLLGDTAQNIKVVSKITNSLHLNAQDRMRRGSGLKCDVYKNYSRTGRLKSIIILNIDD